MTFTIDEGPPPDEADSLFHSGQYFRLHASNDSTSFRLVRDGTAVAAVNFDHVGGGRWRSPGRGTYAGLRWDSRAQVEDVANFLAEVEDRLTARGAKVLEMLPAPMAHDAERFTQTTHLLLARGWVQARTDINQSLVVDEHGLSNRMNRSNQKRLRKCVRGGLTTTELEVRQWREAHELISANRTEKGRTLSMAFDELGALHSACPDRVHVFGCGSPSELAAAAICLRVSSSCLYVFAWGHRSGLSSWSPVVALADGIYSSCQDRGITLLDVGTSSNGLESDSGLRRFKGGLGFEESLKVRFKKQVSTCEASRA